MTQWLADEQSTYPKSNKSQEHLRTSLLSCGAVVSSIQNDPLAVLAETLMGLCPGFVAPASSLTALSQASAPLSPMSLLSKWSVWSVLFLGNAGLGQKAKNSDTLRPACEAESEESSV